MNFISSSLLSPRGIAHDIAKCRMPKGEEHTEVCDQITKVVAQARVDGYFCKVDCPDSSPHDAAVELGAADEMMKAVWDRTA